MIIRKQTYRKMGTYQVEYWINNFCSDYNDGYKIKSHLKFVLEEYMKEHNSFPSYDQFFYNLRNERAFLYFCRDDAVSTNDHAHYDKLDKVIVEIDNIFNERRRKLI